MRTRQREPNGALAWKDKETGQPPPGGPTLPIPSPLGRREWGSSAVGQPAGQRLGWGLGSRQSGFPTPGPGGEPGWVLDRPRNGPARLGSGARLAGPQCRAGTRRCGLHPPVQGTTRQPKLLEKADAETGAGGLDPGMLLPCLPPGEWRLQWTRGLGLIRARPPAHLPSFTHRPSPAPSCLCPTYLL